MKATLRCLRAAYVSLVDFNSSSIYELSIISIKNILAQINLCNGNFLRYSSTIFKNYYSLSHISLSLKHTKFEKNRSPIDSQLYIAPRSIESNRD